MADGAATDRYERQIGLFGAEGQARIGRARVAVLGLGGLGSHVVQQLAYLGVRNYVLVDHDVVTSTNLNRLIGATTNDVDRTKVAVASDLIRTVQPNAEVDPYETKLPNDDAAAAASSTDLILGCFDNDFPRLLLTEIASRAGIPYIDTASGVDTEYGLVYGGRVVTAGLTPGCLSCLHLLDQTEIRRAQMSPEELEVEATIYGVPVESLTGTGPSVVTLNGVIASLGAMEAMVSITGLRKPAKFQRYQGHWGPITRADPATNTCYYCRRWQASLKT
jgi:molybdopterin/thiamine biosynthesis adenylyltransferase